jgi:hypothetical protein
MAKRAGRDGSEARPVAGEGRLSGGGQGAIGAKEETVDGLGRKASVCAIGKFDRD